MVLDERKKQILFAAVQEYILTAEPVSSAKLVTRYRLNVSPATVRNELAALEEAGYLYQPHTSAGRLPTDAGYRYYVDSLVRWPSLADEEMKAVDFLFSAITREMEGLMREASVLLSKITRYVAVVLAPTIRKSAIKHLDLVLLSSQTALTVIITETGLVAKRTLMFGSPISEFQLREVEGILDPWIKGLTSDQIKKGRESLTNAFPQSASIIDSILDEVIVCLGKEEREQVFLEGTSNILNHPEFGDFHKVQSLLETLEHGYAMLTWLHESLTGRGVVVRIGSENEVPSARQYSLVASNYGVDGENLGTVGIIGPTRMDYARAMSAVECIADNLSKALRALRFQ
ncbi:MAG: heat-inducible transcriptional repressor HrcA [Actinobacteria bacterium]|nr:heat-inducible transcriptional repressor HrcA [Actinomycetota bacterium]